MFKYYKVLILLIFLNLLVSCTKPTDELTNSLPFNHQSALNNLQLNGTSGTCERDMITGLSNLLKKSCNINRTEQECETQYSQFKNNFPNINCSITIAPSEVISIFGIQATNLTQSYTIDITEEYINELLYNTQEERACGAIPNINLKNVFYSCFQIKQAITKSQIQINETCRSNISALKEKYPDMHCFVPVPIDGDIYGISPKEIIENIENILSSMEGVDV